MKKKVFIIDMKVEELAEYLHENFPPRCIQPNETEAEAHRYAGQQDLIVYLLNRIRKEKENYGRNTQTTI